MSGLFSKPKIPAPVAAPPVPTVDDARMRIDEQERLRRTRGRASTDVVKEETDVSTAAKRLTGN